MPRSVHWVWILLALSTALGLSACKSDCERLYEAAQWCTSENLDKAKLLESCKKRPRATQCADEQGCEAIMKCLRDAR